jgi:adenine-specific DNA-methyltransferase
VTKPKDDIAKFDLRSEDIAEARRQELLRIFPEVHTESGGINFEALRLSLGDAIQTGPEGFGMSWPGKAECAKTIQRQSVATLLPVESESVNWGTTKNVIIEGDNLEVLKVLQKAYLGKVKMIYIDPPYNTGNDFIYPDNYTESLKTYLQYTNQVDNEGRKFSTSTDSSGRFHSKWMNMMYPRLSLARDLLRDDGVIFVSIDENELRNLLWICDSIFGEDNQVTIFTWVKKRKASNLDQQVRSITEYIVCYRKEKTVELIASEDVPEENKPYPFYNTGNKRAVLKFPGGRIFTQMADGIYQKADFPDNRTLVGLLDDVQIKDGVVVNDFRLEGEWRYSQKSLDEKIKSNERIELKGSKFKPYWINNSERKKFVRTLLDDGSYGVGTNEDGNEELASLLGNGIFSFPKPTALISKLIELATSSDDLILDFFAGSGTTGHAVLAQNAKDNHSRRFVLVQLPEPIDSETDAGKAGFTTIAEIMKERVRRASQQITGEVIEASKNPGFRVLKLSESNFAVWDANSIEGDQAKLEQQLFVQVENVLPGRTSQDILFELLLKSRYELTTPLEQVKVGKCEVWKVSDGEMVAVIDTGLTVEVIREIVSWKPVSVVILDRCFGADDSLKANARKIFEDSKIDLKTV